MLTIPLDTAPQSLLEADTRLEPELTAGLRDIGHTQFDFRTGMRLKQDAGAGPREPEDCLGQAEHRDRGLGIPQVEGAVTFQLGFKGEKQAVDEILHETP